MSALARGIITGCIAAPLIILVLAAVVTFEAFILMVCWGTVASWIDLQTISYVQAILISLMATAIVTPSAVTKWAANSLNKLMRDLT